MDSLERAVRFIGLGTRAIQPLQTDIHGRIAPATLACALGQQSGPTILVLNAADLNVGSCDAFSELIPRAKEARAWVHIDGAFGLWARASPTHRHLLEGVEQADSWATDAHKWLNTPKDIGVAIVRDAAAHRAAMTLTASYISSDGNARDQIDWTPDWTRRARGFAVYAALRELGTDGVSKLIDRCCEHALALALGISSLPRAEMVTRPNLNQGLVRFLASGPGATDVDHDRYTDEIIAKINATGEAFFSGTTWRGRRAMRISVCNWRTSKRDVERTLAAVSRVLGS